MQTPFKAEQFTPTQFSSAANKAEFGNDLISFMLKGFRYADFSDMLYTKLSSCFGHIAHYSRRGFYDTWFSDAEQIQSWIERTTESHPVGSPEHTFSDVERCIQSWFALNMTEIQSVIFDRNEKENATAEQAGEEVEFIIVAISSNTGSFGHKNHIVLGRNGVGFHGARQPKAHGSNRDLVKNEIHSWKVDANGMPTNCDLFETKTPMPEPAPQAVIDEVFG